MEWRPIVGYEGIYEVNDCGQIRRIAPWADGRRQNVSSVKPLRKAHITANGYMRVALRHSGEAQKYHPVHRLVMAAFCGPLPEGHQVNHKNGNKQDNRLQNLEYVTGSENRIHSYRVLKQPTRPGSKHHAAKITEADALAIRALRVRGWTLKRLAKQFGLSVPTVCWIAKGKAWKHI